MTADLRRESRLPLLVAGAFLAIFLLCVVVYVLCGHRLLTAVHSGKASATFSRLAGDRSQPLETYLRTADQTALRYAATAFISFFLYLFLAVLVRRLLAGDANSVRSPPERPPGVGVRELAGAFVIYVVVTLIIFRTVLPDIATRLIGPPEDNMTSLWTVRWAHEALRNGLGFFHTNSIFYPEGSSLLFHTFTPYNLILAVTAGYRLSPVTAYNLLTLQTFAFSGVGAFLLARRITGDTVAALLGGFVFAFSPSHVAQSFHHLNIASLQFVPFFAYFYLRTLDGNSRTDTALAAVFFLLNALCDWTYLVCALFFMTGCYCLLAWRQRTLLLREVLVPSLVIAGSTFVVLSPLIANMLALAARHPQVWAGGYDTYAVDVLGFIVPNNLQSVALPLVTRINKSYPGFSWESVGYLGITCLGLVLSSSRVLVERAARYVLGLLFFIVLTLGPSLRIMGRPIVSVLPYRLIEYMPILSGVRAPGRIAAYAYLFFGMLVAIAFAHQRREGYLRGRGWLAALLALAIIADYRVPRPPMTAVHLPAAYQTILRQDQAADFGLLDLPDFAPCRSYYMMYQAQHGIPIVQGYLARKTSVSLLDSLEHRDLCAQQEQLRRAHVKYIVIHKSFLAPAARAGSGLDVCCYVETYETFYQDAENLVLRVY